MQMELREIQRKLGVTTIFVTHDQSEALSLSDRMAVLSEGRIRQVGTPEEIYRTAVRALRGLIRGRCQRPARRLERVDAIFPAIVALGAARIRVAAASLRHLAVSAAVDLFVRPEQLRLAELDEPCASNGTIVAQVYQGGHVDIYLECADSAAGRVLARLSGPAGYDAPLDRRTGRPFTEHRRSDRIRGRLRAAVPILN